MLATRSPHLFPHDVDHRSAGVVGLRLLVIVAMVGALLFVAPIAPVGAAVPTAANDAYALDGPGPLAISAGHAFELTLGTPGSGNSQFDYPEDVAVDTTGSIYVADTGNDRIQKFAADGTYLTEWGGYGTGNGQFDSPHGVAADTAGSIYVADGGNNRIQKFAADGTYLTEWGGNGIGNGQFKTPYGVAADTAGNIYVADTGNDRIQKFAADGTYLTEWGESGSGDSQFNSPYAVAADTAGNIYVAGNTNDRIQKFTADGTYVTQWSTGQSSWPRGVAADTAGNIYVTDTGNDRIQKFTADGTYLTQWGTYGTGNLNFRNPYGAATDTAGNIYVADLNNHRIQKFTAVAGVLSNDFDTDGDPLTAVLDTNVSHGSLTLNADGSFAYTPTPGFNGTDSFTYHANDGAGDSNVATVTVEVSGNPDPTVFECTEAGLDAAIAVGGGPLTFDCAVPTIVTTTSTKTIASNLILDGEGNLTISGNNSHGVFSVDAGATFEVRGMTITEGGAVRGGAIDSEGAVVVVDSRIVDNEATVNPQVGDNNGGGIRSVGDVTIVRSTVGDNIAQDDGGGIHVGALGTLTVVDSTINHNWAIHEGGGGIFSDGAAVVIGSTITGNTAYVGGGISATSLAVTNSTVSGNDGRFGSAVAVEAPGIFTLTSSTITANTGVGLYIGAGAQTEWTASIVAGNTGDQGNDCRSYVTVTSGGSNLIGDATDCMFSSDPSDLTGSTASPFDPLLGPLADNGGPTLTHALDPASPAIDLGRSGSCAVGDDQRDIGRPIGLGCDAGAFELEGVPTPHFNIDAHSDSIWGHEWTSGQVDIYVDSTLEWTTDVDGSGDFNLDDLGGFDLNTGQVVDIVHTTIPSQHKTHTVLGLTVTVNEGTDTVSGTTNTDALDVTAWVNVPDVQDTVTPVGGAWSVMFNQSPWDHDIVMGDDGGANQCDQDAGDEGDCTFAHWDIPSPDHHFGVDPQHDFVTGWNWPSGGSLTVQVDNDLIPDNGAALKEWTNIPVDGNGNFWLNQDEGPVFDIIPGHVIRVMDENTTDGVGSKDTTVLPLTVDEPVNAGDTGISGTGDPLNGDVAADIHDDPGEHLTVPITGTTWTATFAVSPLTYFINGSVHQTEPAPDDGDRTEIWWSTPSPEFITDYDADTVWSSGDSWIANTLVTINAYDDDMKSTLLGTASTTADSNGEWSIDLTTESVDVNPGNYLVVTQGSILKDHVIIDLTIAVTQDTGNVNGTTDLHSVADYHDVSVWIDNGPSDNVTPDLGTGTWGVDFNTPQHGDYIITAGDSGGAGQPDDDGDRTQISWSVAEDPWFSVTPDAGSIYDPGDRVYGWAFAPDTSVSITISGAPAVYTVLTDGDGYFEYDTWNAPQPGFEHDLAAGQLVTVFDGTTTKSHSVIGLTVAGTVDTGLVGGTSSVYGAVGYDHDVDVWRHNGPGTSVTPDAGNGGFGADFDTAEFGNVVLVPGDGGGASQPDDDGDRTDAYWRIPQPLFNVDVVNNNVWGHEWSAGTLTVTATAMMV